LAVIVGVNIDEAGRHDAAFGVDLLGGGARDLADCSDAPVPDGDICLARRGPRAVDYRSIADDEVILFGHGVSSDIDIRTEFATDDPLLGVFQDGSDLVSTTLGAASAHSISSR
jgi:hypothetical protein